MIKLLLLLKKIHYVLLFLVLETVALYFYTHNDPYKNAAVLASTSSINASVHGNIESVKGYFSLAAQNEMLRNENANLRFLVDQIAAKDTMIAKKDSIIVNIDSISKTNNNVIVVKVVKNSYTKQQNLITIQGGALQGVKPNMALFNADGIVGYVLRCSENFSVAMSVLNSAHFRTSGRLKNTDFTGSISWTGEDYRFVKISELPKYANLHKGDTITTTSFSNIFPPDMPIGVIEDFELASGTFYEASIRLFADLSAINYLYATEIESHDEREELEQEPIL